jgi:hypothetical protein
LKKSPNKIGEVKKSSHLYVIETNVTKMMTATQPRRRKSEKLTPDEYRALVKWLKQFDTQLDGAELIGISREVLARVMIVKSGSPETIGKIRLVLAKDGADSNTK